MAGLFLLVATSSQASAQSLADLQQMSISELENLDVTSVSRSSEALRAAPADIFVITQERILRSGATTLPEILRLAPNLQIAQVSASHYIVTAHGFSGNLADQNFSNQLLVLIDGRSVYSPLYSGVYWDMQDVVPEDIDRIEVISGPGAAMWGANAVNGVINIITKKAADSQGALLSFSGGNLQRTATLRYGGKLGDDVAYRAYVRGYLGDDTESATGQSVRDHWSKAQAGFRLDWTPGTDDTITAQGDAYEGWDAAPAGPSEAINGRNLELRWNHRWQDGSETQAQTYYDHASRGTPGSGTFWVDTYDLDMQHSFGLGAAHTITLGGGGRISAYHISGTSSLYFDPSSRSLGLFNAFVQDSIVVNSALTVTGAVKLEADPYSTLTVLPTLRASWLVNDHVTLWAAASRAVRSPTPFDEDVRERVGSVIALDGDSKFESSQVEGYETGLHIQFGDMIGAISTFYDVYGDLRSVEAATGPATVLNLKWGNNLRGHTAGFDAWAGYQVTPWWRLGGTFSLLAEHFTFAPGSSRFLGVAQLGDDPANTASLRSYIDVTPDINWDMSLRYVSRLPDLVVPAFVELNTAVGWRLSNGFQLSLSGLNLLHARHLEFPASEANAIPRSFAVGLRWQY